MDRLQTGQTTDYSQKNIDMNQATVAQGLDLLATLFDEGTRQYSAINTARSALSLVLLLPNGVSFGAGCV